MMVIILHQMFVLALPQALTFRIITAFVSDILHRELEFTLLCLIDHGYECRFSHPPSILQGAEEWL